MTPNRWWTWNSERPAELIHLASGLQITPVLYAASTDRISLLNPGPEITFGHRPVGDVLIQFTTEVAGTVLQWQYELREQISWLRKQEKERLQSYMNSKT